MTEAFAVADASPGAAGSLPQTEGARPLTPHAPLGRVIMLVNPLSGGVGPNAVQDAETLLAAYDCDAAVTALEPGRFEAQIEEALAARPDVLFVLAGDGTAGTIASRAGPEGPLVAPLPGGTMNMLPKALYGTGDWKAALKRAVEEGAPQGVAGGEVSDGAVTQAFYCAAILGSPALWAPAREAARYGKPGLALQRARRALSRAFTGRVRYSLDGGRRDKAEALVLMCPIASRIMHAEDGRLEAAALNPRGAGEVLRLGINALIRDWRVDPAVEDQFCRMARVWSAQGIPATLDGESVRLPGLVEVRYDPKVCRVLTPPKEDR